ncbi:MAG TPA: adenylate/guanylate cyclase domain-containing protein [Actinomycetota bacterium]|jgi:pimeloyl-ACP methyl ester carboxylesterase|nr:adenylate/guanylate cyclase domain-containing protein [Actinomycetota bacterium]
MTATPTTKYARSSDVHIAYQVFGDGPHDLVLVPGFVSHVEYGWENPLFTHFLERLASFARVVIFDKRGTGMSDGIAPGTMPSLEERMDDARAVMDAAGVHRATLYGISEGGPMAILFAATYPDRVERLVLYGCWIKRLRATDWPHGPTLEEHEEFTRQFEAGWGEAVGAELWAPSLAHLPEFREQWARFLRIAASPGVVGTLFRMNRSIDMRSILPSVRVPTLVIHRAGDRVVPVGQGRYAAEQIPNANYVELPGEDHLPLDVDVIADEIEEFVTGVRPDPQADRVLATVMFTDFVGSTPKASESGDRRWRELLDRHDDLVERELVRFRGRRVKGTGDGVLATFDGPARAVRCAQALLAGVRPLGLGLDLRAGLHTGEIDLRADDVSGIAVHVASRIAELAGPGEVLVSRTVTDLVAGSGLTFVEKGDVALRGVPGRWQLYAVKR